MSSPSVQKSILSMPFSSGLSQKEHPSWLAPGALLTGQNAVHPKTNIVQKRQGFGQLPAFALPPNPATSGGVAFTAGKRLGVDGSKLLTVATDAWTDAVWTFDEQSAAFVFVDRIPEVYALPDRTIASYDDTIREMDVATCNGYNVYVWLVSANSGNATGIVYYKVENASTGESVLPPQVLDRGIPFDFPGFGGEVEQRAPKCVTVGPTKVIIGLHCGNTGGGNLAVRLYVLDCTIPWVGVSSATSVATKNVLQQQVGSWDIDVCPVLGVNYALICYQSPNFSSGHYQLIVQPVIAVGIAGLGTPTDISTGDPQYLADGGGIISSFGIECNGNYATVAYAWSNGGAAVLRVGVLLYSILTASVQSTAVNLLSQSGPLNPTGLQPPLTISVASVTGLAGTHSRVAWSSGQSEWAGPHPDGTQGAFSAFIATWSLNFSASAGVIDPNMPRVTGGVALASRWLPNVNGIGYILGRIPSWEQGTYFMFADDSWQDITSVNNDNANGETWYPMRLVATFAPRLSSWIFEAVPELVLNVLQIVPYLQDRSQPHSVPHIIAQSAIPGISVYQSMISVSSTTQAQNPTLATVDMASTLSYANAALGLNTGFATGTPSVTDGVRVHEFAFPYYPSIGGYGATQGAGNIPPGQYGYIAIYDWIDARGQLHRSARSGAYTVVFSGTGTYSVEVFISTMGFSGKEKALLASSVHNSPQSVGHLATAVTVRLFRTQLNGEIYYEVGSCPNVQGTNSVTIVDTLSDAQISTNSLLYGDGLDAEAQGAILDNLCPPAFQQLIVHNNRFIGIDGTNVWASKELTSGEGAGFNEIAAFSWDDGTGPIMAAASMDGKLILWKTDRVGYVTGQGPADDGGQNDWSPPQSIVTDVGCINWRSLVVKPDGIYFDSLAGERILTRDLQVQPVPNVEDLMTANGTQTSAVVHPTQGRILITANTDDVSTPRAGIIVDRDYILDSWLTTLPQVGAVSAVVADAPYVGPTYHWLDASGIVWREDAVEWQDFLAASTAYVPMQIETAWVKASGIEGFARFRRLQLTWQNLDPHALSVYVAFDYSPTYYLMGTVTAAMMADMPLNPMCQQLFSLPRQRAESVRFKVVDSPDAVTPPFSGQGPMLVSMGLEVSRYTNNRTNRLPAAQRT